MSTHPLEKARLGTVRGERQLYYRDEKGRVKTVKGCKQSKLYNQEEARERM